MFKLLNKKNQNQFLSSKELTTALKKLIKIYDVENINPDRKKYFINTFKKFGYLPYPQFKVLEELDDREAIFCLIQKLKCAGTLVDDKFIDFKNPSYFKRNNIKNSKWFKKEGHNIKLLSLSALGDGKEDKPGRFIDWVKCLISLDSGNLKLNILPTTIYLIPFFAREFDCAYLPKSSEVSPKLQDDKVKKFLGYDAQAQVKLFIELAQLANHPVIYDILPQTARFSKMVLLKPEIARWIDVKELDNEIKASKKTKDDLLEYKKVISNKMCDKKKQEELRARVNKVVSDILQKTPKTEDDIVKQDEIVALLIKQGLWTMPGGAWCSAGVPVYDKMSKNNEYPTFKHYNYKGEDVTRFANLDCQTPFYFFDFKEKKYNKDVIDFFINYNIALQERFNFDGFRIDHIDHVVDEVSKDNEGNPISYRIPSCVLGKLNSTMKKKMPYFATLAEYMLWDGYYKEYHKDMSFDLLWGDDIVSQCSKTPEQIINDNMRLALYNQKQGKTNPLSILKTYNNQDGEFRDINQYPAQMGKKGALFKWFKLKFITGGKFALRPTLLIDGDESYTKTGIERIISKETSMIRNDDWKFFEKFHALNYFAQHDKLLNNSNAKLVEQDSDGFAVWQIIPEDKKTKENYIIIANYIPPTEIKDKKSTKGQSILDKTLKLKRGKKLTSYYDFKYDEEKRCFFEEIPLKEDIKGEINFKELKPAEFKMYKMI